MLEKLPQASNDSPSTRPLTKQQTMRSPSVHLVLISARKYRDTLPRNENSGEVVSWFPPDIETFVLAPRIDQKLPSVVSSLLSKRDFKRVLVASSWYVRWRASGSGPEKAVCILEKLLKPSRNRIRYTIKYGSEIRTLGSAVYIISQHPHHSATEHRRLRGIPINT